MDHDYRMQKLEEMREEQLKREHGHPEGKGHMYSQHHSMRDMLGMRNNEMENEDHE